MRDFFNFNKGFEHFFGKKNIHSLHKKTPNINHHNRPNFELPQEEGVKPQKNLPPQNPKPPLSNYAQKKAMFIHNNTPLSNIVMSKMNSGDKAVFIRELLKLPEDFEKLMKQFVASNGNIQHLLDNKNQSLTNSKVNISNLLFLLKNNSKEAVEKLMMMISTNNKSGITDVQQLKELLFVLNACVPNENVSANILMKNLILLYLPWLPLGEQNNFHLSFQRGNSEEEDNEDLGNIITIEIQTINFGIIIVVLTVDKTQLTNIEIKCPKNFPKADLKEFLKETTKGYNINAGVNFEETKTIKEQVFEKQNIDLNVLGEVNPYLMMIAHAIIRKIIKIDKNMSSC